MQSTSYGLKKEGSSPFVIVAPHAAGDDLRTKEMALSISKFLNAFVVVNDMFIKETNSRANENPQIVEDFNKLNYIHNNSIYEWKGKHNHMREFYDHVEEFNKSAQKYGGGQSVTIFIHGLKDNKKRVGIDIGFGAKEHRKQIKGTGIDGDKHPDAGGKMGEIRAEIDDILDFKEILEDKLIEKHELRVGLGEYYAGWSKENGIQYNTHLPGYSLQLEIAYSLRKSNNLEYTSKLIAEALKRTYSYLS